MPVPPTVSSVWNPTASEFDFFWCNSKEERVIKWKCSKVFIGYQNNAVEHFIVFAEVIDGDHELIGCGVSLTKTDAENKAITDVLSENCHLLNEYAINTLRN